MSSFDEPLQYENTGRFLNGQPVHRLTKPFQYQVGSLNNSLTYSIVVPEGFLTDLASIPYPLRYIFHPDGPWVKAAVIHDYLYKMRDFDLTHAIPDAIFYEAMLVCKVNKIIAMLFWLTVVLFGTVETTPIEMRWTTKKPIEKKEKL